MTVGQSRETAVGQPWLRASTADREQVVEVLKTAFTDGRLTKDEYDVRVSHALSATTFSDLDRLTADLLVAPPVHGTNSMAIASLALGAGQLLVGPLSTVPAIVCGHKARKQIRQTGEDGGGLALAGLLLGYVGATLTVLFLLFVAAGIVLFVHAAGGTAHVAPVIVHG